MNLQNVARCIILIWLPLASLEIMEKRPRGRGSHPEEVRIIEIGKRKDEEGGLEVGEGSVRNGNGASHVSPTKTSAKSSVQVQSSKDTREASSPSETSTTAASVTAQSADEKAHGLIFSLKKDLSALNVISDNLSHVENTSAAVMLPDVDGRKTKSRNLHEWMRKRKRRKKRETPVGGGRNEGKPAVGQRSPFVADEEYDDEEGGNDEDDNDEVNLEELDNEDIGDANSTELGRYVGSPCEATCSEKLVHVFCDPTNRICECEKKYPVQIGIGRGCAKPKQLGDQCFYAQTCSFSDPNAICMQINHNAICQCKPGYHSVALRRGAKKSFCSEDQVVVSTDLPTLLGVATGIAVLTGLICFVLKLFNNNRYPERRRYNNANVAPPLLFSSDNQWINGIPLTVHGRPSSRTSSQRSTTNLAHYPRSKGVLVPASRAGAARAAAILLIPCHLQGSKSSNPAVGNRSRNDESDAQENDKENTSRPGNIS